MTWFKTSKKSKLEVSIGHSMFDINKGDMSTLFRVSQLHLKGSDVSIVPSSHYDKVRSFRLRSETGELELWYDEEHSICFRNQTVSFVSVPGL